MQNLIKNISLSCAIGISGVVFAQRGNKYLRINENAIAIEYSNNKCSARGILHLNNKIYFGNSDGSLISYNLETRNTFNFMEGKKIQEMRDLAYCNGFIYGMQSGTDGLLVKVNENEFADFVFPKNNQWAGTFLDGMDFFANTGFIMGDPKNGVFQLFYSIDGGTNWLPCEGSVSALEGEAGFAASGTNVQVLNDSTFMFVTGGMQSRFFKSTDQGKTWSYSAIPFLLTESSGAFSMHFKNINEGVIVGGDYKNPELRLNNSYYTTDGGQFWNLPDKTVNGYRSCVHEANGIYYACGTNGIDYSSDNGENWHPFAKGNFLALTSNQEYLFASTPNGSFTQFKLVK